MRPEDTGGVGRISGGRVGRVIVELNDKQMMKIDPEKDEEWRLVA